MYVHNIVQNSSELMTKDFLALNSSNKLINQPPAIQKYCQNSDSYVHRKVTSRGHSSYSASSPFPQILEDMAVYVVCLLLLLAMVAFSDAAYCLCNTGVNNTVLQQNIDYACGNGADCSAILLNGSCFLPNTVNDHCNYAVNSYYQRKGQTNGSCDFKGTASPSQTPPSNLAAGCVYQSSPSNGSSPAPPFSPGGTPPNSPPGSGFISPPGSFVPPSSFENGTDATLLSRSVVKSILACFLVNFLIYGFKWPRI